jgi:hypothetical protein
MSLSVVRCALASSVLLTTLCAVGCDTPETVSKYCDSSVQTLTAVTTVLSDMAPSCLREVNQESWVLGSFKPPATSDASCEAIEKQQTAAVAAAKLLAEYFGALDSLSAYGYVAPSKDAKALADAAAGIADLSTTQTGAIDSLAQGLTKGIVSGYQFRKLATDIPKAQHDVDSLVDALLAIVQQNYVNQLLRAEEKKSANPYKEFLNKYSPPPPEVVLALDQRWKADEQAISAKRASALCAVSSLKTMRDGIDSLAANATTLKRKEVAGLLAPYASDLQSLVPQIQKAY